MTHFSIVNNIFLQFNPLLFRGFISRLIRSRSFCYILEVHFPLFSGFLANFFFYQFILPLIVRRHVSPFIVARYTPNLILISAVHFARPHPIRLRLYEALCPHISDTALRSRAWHLLISKNSPARISQLLLSSFASISFPATLK